MSKPPAKPAESPTAANPQKPTGKHAHQDPWREFVESIVVAFVLAFLFRTFIAEAFVIPTGSMAPTLFGRHKDVACPQCGLHYEVGASEELDHDEGVRLLQRIKVSTCPNCRYTSDIYSLPVFKGDRILVNKFPYEIGDLKRWDVCVFKFPEVPERNYIKRLIGLPGETIRLSRGDVYARPRGAAGFEIQRKADPGKQNALQILVYDDAHPPQKLLEQGWPERWAAMQRDAAPGAIDGWTPNPDQAGHDANARKFALKSDADWSWLRYRHVVPTPLDWDSVAEGAAPTTNPRPQLITDYYGYNAFAFSPHQDSDDDAFWVGDLTVSGEVDVQNAGAGAALQFELVEGVRRYRCEIDVATGKATLSHTNDLQPDGEPIVLATAETAVAGPGRYRFTFANVDDRLSLWINPASWWTDKLVEFSGHGEYQPAALAGPQEADLLPAGLAVRGATAEFSRLLLRRDIYYRAEQLDNDVQFPQHSGAGEASDLVKDRLRDLVSNPREYAALYNERATDVEFAELRDDEYFVMGDNSPRSQDSRLWTNRRGAVNRHAVPRQAMVGKAFAIYWPHGIPFLNGGKGYSFWMHKVGNNQVENYPEYTAPFYPQAPTPFGRWMARIR
jgi:signal peptidase I